MDGCYLEDPGQNKESETKKQKTAHSNDIVKKGKNGGATLKAQKDLEKAIKDGGVFSGYNI